MFTAATVAGRSATYCSTSSGHHPPVAQTLAQTSIDPAAPRPFTSPTGRLRVLPDPSYLITLVAYSAAYIGALMILSVGSSRAAGRLRFRRRRLAAQRATTHGCARPPYPPPTPLRPRPSPAPAPGLRLRLAPTASTRRTISEQTACRLFNGAGSAQPIDRVSFDGHRRSLQVRK
jgi:hypothetical protein